MPRSFLLQAGLNPEKDFKHVAFSGAHDATVAAVAAGKVQAGALNISVWEKLVADGKVDTAKVRVFFNGATPTCHGWQAEVSENAVAVTIKLYEGGLPGAPTDCSAEGVRGSLVVDLEKPLGNRLVLQ